MAQRSLVLALLAASSAASAAPVTITKPTVTGTLDVKTVDATVQRARAKVLACAKQPVPDGAVVVTFQVGADGKVANAFATGASPEVRTCISDAVTKLAYGKSKSGAVAVVVLFGEPKPVAEHEPPPAPIGANKPSVSAGQPNAQGDLDKAIIRRYIKRNIQHIQYCYEKTLLEKPGIAGTVMVEFVIGRDGKVVSSTGSGLDKVDTCVADVIKGIEFPKPQGGGNVQVNYPFVFHEANDH